MQQPVVFDTVWKKFRRGERHNSLRDLIPSLVKRAWQRDDVLAAQEFWALRDMSFSVGAGEAIGIVGTNGAGKSTILKLLTRILKPTLGHCRVTGRVGALIEVASSFHPDLTGRENVYLQGAIMGMKRAETARRFDEIVEFADVGPFIDTPVKRYSNGMNARLGFSVAAHLDPHVLLIDEVLSVGDLAFQERCLERLHYFKRRGAAIVLVSHNMSAIAALCDTAMVVIGGRLQHVGPADQALAHYLQLNHGPAGGAPAPLEFERVAITDRSGHRVVACESGARLQVTAHVRILEPVADVGFGLAVHQSASNVCAYAVESSAFGLQPATYAAGDTVEVSFAFEANLVRGRYGVELTARGGPGEAVLARRNPAAFLQVREAAAEGGVADLRAQCHIGNASRLMPAPTAAQRARPAAMPRVC